MRFLVFVFSFIYIFSASAQKVSFQGKVIDAETLEPLAFVSVAVKNTSLGTTTSIDGKFSLYLPLGFQEITFSFVGFEDFHYAATPDTKQSAVTIFLHEKTTILKEVVLNAGENPANRIILETIQHKAFNDPYNLPSFSYQSYNKFYCTLDGFRKDTIETIKDSSKLKLFLNKNHLFFGESLTERKFLKPHLSKEVVLANRMSGYSNPIVALLATDLQPLSFYDEVVVFLEKKYINPISKGSLSKYEFFLESTQLKNGDTTFIISFRPIPGKNFDGLKGIVSVNSSGYAIESIIAESDDKSSLKKFKIQQKYEKIGEAWFPVELNSDIIFTDFKVRGHSLMLIGKSYLNKVQIAPALNKKQFDNIEVEMLPEANTRSEAYWMSIRPDSLERREANTYVIAKKIGRKRQAFLDGFMNFFEGTLTNDLKIGKISLEPDKFYNYNQYEENRFGVGIHTNERLSRLVNFGGYVAYGSKDKALKFGFEAQLNVIRKRDFCIRFNYNRDIVEPGVIDFFEDTRLKLHTVSNWIAYRMDSIERLKVSVNIRPFDHIQIQLSVSKENRNPAYEYTYRSVSKPDFSNTLFNTSEFSAGIRYAPREAFTQIGSGKAVLSQTYPIFTLSAGHNLSNNFSSSYYSRVNLNIDYSFYSKALGQTLIQFSSGIIKGDAPYFLLNNGQGSYSTSWPKSLYQQNHFQTMYLYEFLSSQYAYLFLTHNFGKLLYNTKNKYIQPELLLVQNIGFGRLEQSAIHQDLSYSTLEKGFYETGVAINNLFRISYINLMYIGFGGGAFYRYGTYAYPKSSDNIVYKASINFTF